MENSAQTTFTLSPVSFRAPHTTPIRFWLSKELPNDITLNLWNFERTDFKTLPHREAYMIMLLQDLLCIFLLTLQQECCFRNIITFAHLWSVSCWCENTLASYKFVFWTIEQDERRDNDGREMNLWNKRRIRIKFFNKNKDPVFQFSGNRGSIHNNFSL